MLLNLIVRSVLGMAVFALFLFLPAGTLDWPQAWVFLAIFSIASVAIGLWLLKIDPASYLGNLRLAFAVYNLGRYPEAATLYRRLGEMYPSDVDVRDGLGWSLLKMGKPAEAAVELRAVLEVAPRNALALDGMKAAGAGR